LSTFLRKGTALVGRLSSFLPYGRSPVANGLFSLLVSISMIDPALPGHGFISAFGNIQWLPAPDRTPDSTWHSLKVVSELGRLLLTRDPETKLRLYLSFAKEKLAELEAMVKSEQGQAARMAADWRQTYLERAKELLDSQPDQDRKEVLAESMAAALLEQQYIL